MNDVLAQAIEAVRAADLDGGADDASQATGFRVRRSLEARARWPRVWAAIAAALGLSTIGGVAFAIATGRWAVLGGAKAEPARPAIVAALPAAPRHVVAAAPALSASAPPIAEAAPIEVPHAPAPVRHAAAPAPRVSRATEIEAAYRRAHDLHFHGDDPSAALTAWDDYLRADPSGRFAAEARFNRAIDLVRLGRYDDARAALAPFARGEVAPAGYRRDDARALVDRLDAIGAPDSTIVAGPGTTR